VTAKQQRKLLATLYQTDNKNVKIILYICCKNKDYATAKIKTTFN